MATGVYATFDDVQRRVPQFTITEVSKPSTTSVQIFIDDVHAQFEAAMLNLGYQVPLTGARSLAQAREIVCQGVIARILYARGASLGTEAAFQSADRAQKQYDDALKALADPKSPVELVDAVRTDEQVEKPGNLVSGLIYDTDGAEIEPRITMSTKF